MILDLARGWLAGTAVFVWAFNRWGMVEPDDRVKLRRAFWLLPACLGIPPILVAILPRAISGGFLWAVFAGVVLLEVARQLLRLVGFSTTRSKAVPVPGLAGRWLTTRALQVRSYQFAEAPAALDGLVAVFVSDLHCDGAPSAGWYDRVWETVRGIGPDLLLLGGDYLSSPGSVPFLERCLAGLRDQGFPLGAWGVLGNHDLAAPDDVRRLLREAGVGLLEDRWTVLDRGGRSIVLQGTGAPFWPDAGNNRVPPLGGVDLALSHTPDNAPALASRGCRFVLSGHLHGGQFALPLIGGLLAPSRWSRRWLHGAYSVGGARLVVSAGLGCSVLPIRLLVPPEIVVLRFFAAEVNSPEAPRS